jgi:hypothetical protein
MAFRFGRRTTRKGQAEADATTPVEEEQISRVQPGLRSLDDADDADDGATAEHTAIGQELTAEQQQIASQVDIAVDEPATEDDTGGLGSAFTDVLGAARGRGKGTEDFETDVTSGLEDDESQSGQRYGKDQIAQSGGDRTTEGIGYGIPTTDEGEVTNSPASSFFGELQGYKQYEQEMTEQADALYEQRHGSGGGSGSGGSGSGSGSGSGGGGTGGSSGAGTPGVVHEQDSGNEGEQNPSHTVVLDDGTIITTYESGDIEQVTSYPDGTTETDHRDGTLVTEYADGSKEIIHPDGTVENVPPPEPEPAPETEPEPEGEAEPEPEGEAPPEPEPAPEPEPEPEEEPGGGVDSTPDDEYAPLPEDIQQQIDADLARLRALKGSTGDGHTDPNEHEDNVVIDRSIELETSSERAMRLFGQPPDPEFQTGGHGGGVPNPGADSQGGGVIDPTDEQDTGPRAPGREDDPFDRAPDIEPTAPEPEPEPEEEDADGASFLPPTDLTRVDTGPDVPDSLLDPGD